VRSGTPTSRATHPRGGHGTAMGTAEAAAHQNGNDAAYFEPSQVSVKNGLNLTATRVSSQPAMSGLRALCRPTANSSSRAATFRSTPGCRTEMGCGRGSGCSPAPAARQVIISRSTSSRAASSTAVPTALEEYAWHLHTPGGTGGGGTNVNVDLSADYHVYGLNWVPGQSITWYLDGRRSGK